MGTKQKKKAEATSSYSMLCTRRLVRVASVTAANRSMRLYLGGARTNVRVAVSEFYPGQPFLTVHGSLRFFTVSESLAVKHKCLDTVVSVPRLRTARTQEEGLPEGRDHPAHEDLEQEVEQQTIHTSMYEYVYVYVYVYVYISLSLYIYIYMNTHIHIYI